MKINKIIKRIVKFFKKNRGKGIITLINNKNVYKIAFSPIGIIRLLREVKGSRSASSDSFFYGHVSILNNICFLIGKSKRKEVIFNEEYFNFLVESLIEKACNSSRELIKPSKIIKFDWVDWIPKNYNIVKKLEINNFDKYKLPLSPQHGDLKRSNAVWDSYKNCLYLIDWELFCKEGSFILDYIDYQFRNSLNESNINYKDLYNWVNTNDESIDNIALKINVSQKWLKAVFLLDRCQRTMKRLCMSNIGQIYKNTKFYKVNLKKVANRYKVAVEILSKDNEI